MAKGKSKVTGTWTQPKPATEAAIRNLVKSADFDLPADHLAFLRKSDGGEGDLGVEPGWIVLWSANELVDANRDYCVSEFMPGFFGFGSNGGGEMFAFDFHQPGKASVVMVPFIPMDADEAVLLGRTFSDFAKHFGKSLENSSKEKKPPKGKTRKD